jgi:hypothetical protein
MEILEGATEQKKSNLYDCKICNVICSTKYNFVRHQTTAKHKKLQNGNNLEGVEIKMEQMEQSKFICECKKIYNTNAGLWKHKQKCIAIKKNYETKLSPDNLMNVNVICELIKQNNEFKNLLIEQNNKIIEISKCNNITNNTTNNNQKFNMNFFLNEQCKGALDIMDFVSSLKVQLSDLENTGNVGYVKGISNIFLRGLKELDVYKRPIHCSDLKREVMYVKDNDVWEKDEDKKKIKKVIQNIAHKNFKQINDWVEENPESKDIQTKKHDQYMRIICKCTGGIDFEEDDVFYNKIISNVAKEVQIDK